MLEGCEMRARVSPGSGFTGGLEGHDRKHLEWDAFAVTVMNAQEKECGAACKWNPWNVSGAAICLCNQKRATAGT